MIWHLVTPRPLEFWYRLDLAHLEICDALWRLPGESTGADAEAQHARTIGMPVFTTEALVRAWCQRFGG
jgi:hypothetical protein